MSIVMKRLLLGITVFMITQYIVFCFGADPITTEVGAEVGLGQVSAIFCGFMAGTYPFKED